MSAFAYELGVFDPTFPGITIHFPNEATWKEYQADGQIRCMIVAQDMLRKDSHLSLHDIDEKKIAQDMATDLNYVNPLHPDDKEKLGRGFINQASSPERAVEFFAVASALVHERRHFHDWMLSPYAALINAIRIEVFFNYESLFPFLLAGGVTVIPVPLTRWMRKSIEDQAKQIEMWRQLLDKVEVRVPRLTRQDVLSCIADIELKYKMIGTLFQPVSGTDLDSASVFEASALLIQTQAIHDGWGETAHQLFFNSMSQHGRYRLFPKLMASLVQPGQMLEVTTLSILATWCLLGNANPLTRMMHVFRYVKEKGFPKVSTSSQEIFTALDKACGAVSYIDDLTESIRLGDRFLSQLMTTKRGTATKFSAAIIQTYAFLHDCHKYMVRLFLEDPDGYSTPTGYLDRIVEKLPEPPLRHTFGQPFFKVKRNDLAKYEQATLFERESTGQEVFLRQFIEPNWTRYSSMNAPEKFPVDLRVADNWQNLCSQVDTFFTEYNRDRPEIEYHKQSAREEGLYLLEVF